jgi:4-alpha-glucanotransferase
VSVPTLLDRASGLLLHPTCLPGPHGSGDLGREARAFVDFLAAGAQRWWQMLPVGPPGYGESPYSAQSTFAGSPMLIALEPLVARGWLDEKEIVPAQWLADDHVEFPPAEEHRMRCLAAAFDRWSAKGKDAAFDAFCAQNDAWLDDFALFRALKRAHGGVQWTRWEAGVRRRDPKALAAARAKLARDVALEKFAQYVFADQWAALRAYAAERGIGLIGDIPIFVAHDSADVWQDPGSFFLDEHGEPTVVSGCPPDYFSTTGQRWGNPLYRWGRMKKGGYPWWAARLRAMLQRFDAIRIDHFIGFQRYWRIPADEPTAVKGMWMKGPGADFFVAMRKTLGDLPLIAEDLGAVTPAVFALRDRFRLPGIKILQFAFGTDPNAPTFLPHNYRRRSVVFTGTHDNDTTVGWFHDKGGGWSTRTPAQTQRERETVLRYLGTSGAEIHWDMIRLALASVARTALFPLQDVLGLGSEARMNRPGKETGNWMWRFSAGALSAAHAERLATFTRTYGR